MTFTAKIQPYKIYEVSWTTTPPTDLAVGVGDDGIANTFSIIEGPDDLSVKLNSKDNDLIEFGEGVDNVNISEIYITSAEINTSVKIYAAWEGS
jgi:hypothetical protein